MSEIHYLAEVTYTRVPLAKISELKRLLNGDNIRLVDDYLENVDKREIFERRLLKRYPENYLNFYENREFYLSTFFRLLERIFNNNETLFPGKETKQLSLIANAPEDEQRTTTSIIFTGQATKFRYCDYSGASYLDYANIVRILKFLKRIRILEKEVLLNELNKLTTNDYEEIKTVDFRKYINVYNEIDGKITKKEEIDHEIWSLSEDDWDEFKGFKASVEGILIDLKNLHDFFNDCLRYRRCWVLMRHYYV